MEQRSIDFIPESERHGSLVICSPSGFRQMLYFMVPWTAINLVDFYLLRKGKYNIAAIFNPKGEYGRINWIAIVAYVLAVLLQFPFMNTERHVGVFAKYMHGAGIA